MPETLNQRWAATIAGTLAACGVRHVVIAPGSRSTPLALAFADRPDLTCWSCIDERSAAFFALGLSKGAAAPAAVLCTSGTAGAHFLPAIIEASEGCTPLIAITADRPFELLGFGAPQTIDQRGLFGRFVRAELDLPAPDENFEHLIASVSRTAQRATATPRGAVHFNVPFREPLANPDGVPGPVVTMKAPRFPVAGGTPALDTVRAAIASTTRGAIVCGPRERDDGFAEAVHALGRALGFPVFAEAASNARFGYPEAIWCLDTLTRAPRFSAAMRPDVVLRFGGALTAKAPQQWLDACGARVFAFSDDGHVFDPAHRAEVVFTGDVVAMMQALTPATPREGPLSAFVERAQGRVEAALRSQPFRVEEALIATALVKALPAGANLVLSSSMPIRDVDTFAASQASGLRVFSNRGVNGIDGVVSTALGVSASTQRPTALLIGDVAALHDLSGWLLSRTQRVPLIAVVVNNDGGGIFSFLPVAERTPHFERYFGTPHGVDFGHLAAFSGATLHRPTSLAELRRAVDVGVEGGLHLIELTTDRAQNVEAHRALNAVLIAAAES